MKQRGFTLIELVVVIALLGVLSAIALPRFIDVTDDAKDAAVSATLGSFSTGVALARSAWFAKGGSLSSITLDGVTFEYSAEGWPKGSGTSLASCSELWRDLMHSAPSIGELGTTTPGDTDWIVVGGGYPSCMFLHTPDSIISTNKPFITYNFTTTSNGPAGAIRAHNFP